MDPQQLLVPKLSVNISSNGSLVSPPLEDLSPLSLDQLQQLLLTEIHPNSVNLNRKSNDIKGDDLLITG